MLLFKTNIVFHINKIHNNSQIWKCLLSHFLKLKVCLVYWNGMSVYKMSACFVLLVSCLWHSALVIEYFLSFARTCSIVLVHSLCQSAVQILAGSWTLYCNRWSSFSVLVWRFEHVKAQRWCSFWTKSAYCPSHIAMLAPDQHAVCARVCKCVSVTIGSAATETQSSPAVNPNNACRFFFLNLQAFIIHIYTLV